LLSSLLSDDARVRLEIEKRHADIRELAVNDASADAMSQERLLTAGLLFKRPACDPHSVKFYVVLRRIFSTDVPESIELDHLQKALSSRAEFLNASLYAGSGSFADYLIRVVAPSYSDVLRYTSMLDSDLSGMPFRP
jgi:hypothetical protein